MKKAVGQGSCMCLTLATCPTHQLLCGQHGFCCRPDICLLLLPQIWVICVVWTINCPIQWASNSGDWLHCWHNILRQPHRHSLLCQNFSGNWNIKINILFYHWSPLVLCFMTLEISTVTLKITLFQSSSFLSIEVSKASWLFVRKCENAWFLIFYHVHSGNLSWCYRMSPGAMSVIPCLLD